MATEYSITEYFGRNLAELLSDKIVQSYPDFNSENFIEKVNELVAGKTYTQRILVIAEQLKSHLPNNYDNALTILISILGEENPNETGMFKNYYWIMPIGKFISVFGLDYFESSIKGIEEVTKRNTGEYAIRPFIVNYPEKTLEIMEEWANSPNFHLRRLASEGLRPKLPWAPKLDTFIENPAPVFRILDILKRDDILFVKKSVANHLTDWIKVNSEKTIPLIEEWRKIDNPNTKWIIKRATRKMK
jgi:3-methyladenine DNA glycosylase AlkC